MPNIKSAKKKMRQDAKKTKINDKYLAQITKTMKSLKKSKEPAAKLLKKAYSVIDKAKKRKAIHKNKAARLKARVSKLLLSKKK